MSAGSFPQFGAKFSLNDDGSTKDIAQQIQAVDAGMVELAAALNKGEIGIQQYSEQAKALAAVKRELARAADALATAEAQAAQAQEETASRTAEQVQSQVQWIEKKKQAAADAAQSGLAHQAELEALAVSHETEMLEHEQRQLLETAAAEDAAVAAIGRWVAAENAAEAEAAQLAAGLARQTAARSSLTAAEERELASLARSIAAQDAAEAEAEQLAAAMLKEQNAIFAAEGAMENFTADASVAASAQGRLAGAAGATRSGMGSLQQSITAGSYAFQDFTATSGDLGAKLNSISNNLPTLLIGLGGLGVALSVAGTAAIAVYRNWDSIASLWEDRNPFPKAAGDVDGLKRELDRAKDALEKMEKAGSGNADQLAEYNRLRTETVRIEKEIADQQERQKTLKKALESSSEEDEGRAKGFKEATAGKGQETLDSLIQAYRNDIEDSIDAERVATAGKIFAIRQSTATDAEKDRLAKEEYQRLEKAINVLRDPANDPAKLAEDLFIRLAKGEENAFKALDRLNEGLGVSFDSLKDAVDKANPVLKKKYQEQFEAAQKELEAEIKAGTHEFKAAFAAAQKELEAEIREATKQGKAEFAGAKKDLATETKEGKKEDNKDFAGAKARLEAEIRETERRDEAEAKRIHAVVGDHAKDQFGLAVSQNPGQDPEQVALRVATAMVQAFQRMGATAGGARVAAQQLAGQAGFRVTQQQLFGALNPARQQRRIVARPKAGKRPIRQPKIVKAKPEPPRRDPRAARTEAEIAAEKRAKQQPKTAPQASLPKAVDLVAQVQEQQARAQATEAAMLTRIAFLEQHQRGILLNENSLVNRARENQSSALRSGSSTT
jgi:hypothetical protein